MSATRDLFYLFWRLYYITWKCYLPLLARKNTSSFDTSTKFEGQIFHLRLSSNANIYYKFKVCTLDFRCYWLCNVHVQHIEKLSLINTIIPFKIGYCPTPSNYFTFPKCILWKQRRNQINFKTYITLYEIMKTFTRYQSRIRFFMFFVWTNMTIQN